MAFFGKTPALRRVVCAAAAAAVCAVCAFVGRRFIGPTALFDWGRSTVEGIVLLDFRLPRVAAAFMAGSALAVCGMTLQALFQNPLASPFTLGVSSGAALGALVAIHAGFVWSAAGLTGTSIAAFAGSVAVVLLISGAARLRRDFSSSTLILAGVGVSLFVSSVNVAIQYLSDMSQTYRIVHWMMGSLEAVFWRDAAALAPLYAGCVLMLFFYRDELDIMATGDEIALSRGVDTERVRLVLFLVSSLLVGAVVSVCGPIGFIDLVVPHIVRLLIGPSHKRLFPAVLVTGGVFLVVCDTIGRTLLAYGEVPAGIICALFGGPVFVWLLLRSSNRRT